MGLKFNPLSGQFDYDSGGGTSGQVPLTVAAGQTFTVPANTQVLHAVEITNNGTITNNGQLVKVRSA